MSFVEDNMDLLLSELQNDWENARIKKNQDSTIAFAESIFDKHTKRDIKLLVRGTAFQIKVWEALLKIPFGSVTSYQTIANTIGSPNGMRAVGSAVGANPIAY
jgi:AraC family transcriptional regulator of adaptative response/methylated-DNA-[protein]-cysteine methyltransferase